MSDTVLATDSLLAPSERCTNLAVKPRHTQLSFQEHGRLRDIVRSGSLLEAETVLAAHVARTRTTYSAEVEDIAALHAGRPEA